MNPDRSDRKERQGRASPTPVKGRISVIIPSFNYARFLPVALESVFAQNVPDLEVVLVDDGSTDDTRAVVQRYGGRIRYFHQPNRGQAAARNVGLSNCTGEFIQFLDADDALAPNTLSAQLAFLRARPSRAVAVCPSRYVATLDLSTVPQSRLAWPLMNQDHDVHLCYFNIAPLHAFFCRRVVVAKAGCFDETLIGQGGCEDYDLWLRAAMNGFVPETNATTAVYYRRHPGSWSAQLHRKLSCDNVLHHRLSAMLDEHPRYASGRRFAALLAFCAGSTTTAARRLAHDCFAATGLLELAQRKLHEASTIAPTIRAWGYLEFLYFCWAVAAAERKEIRLHPLGRELRAQLSSIGDGSSDFSTAIAAMRVALRLPPAQEVERRFLFRSVLRRLVAGALGADLSGRLRPPR